MSFENVGGGREPKAGKNLLTRKAVKYAPVDSFKNEYELMEMKWLMGKLTDDSSTLMDDAELHFTNLNSNKNVDHRPWDQIVEGSSNRDIYHEINYSNQTSSYWVVQNLTLATYVQKR